MTRGRSYARRIAIVRRAWRTVMTKNENCPSHVVRTREPPTVNVSRITPHGQRFDLKSRALSNVGLTSCSSNTTKSSLSTIHSHMSILVVKIVTQEVRCRKFQICTSQKYLSVATKEDYSMGIKWWITCGERCPRAYTKPRNKTFVIFWD